MNNYQHQGPLPPFISPFDDDPLEPNQNADYSYLSDEPVNSRYDPETGIEEFNEPTVMNDVPVSSRYDEETGIEEFGAPYIEEPQQQAPLGLLGPTQAPPVLFRAPIPPAQQPTLAPRAAQQPPAALFRESIPPAQQPSQQPARRQGLDINVHPRYSIPIIGELYDMVFGERGDRATGLGIKAQKRVQAGGVSLVAPQQYDTSRRVPFNSVVSPSVNRR